jgi:CysZ protein
MHNFLLGMRCFFFGLQRLNCKGIRAFIVMPILFNLLLYGAIIFFAYQYMNPLIQHYMSKLPQWLSFLSTLFTVFFFLLFILVFLSTFSIIFNIFAAPFNGFLAEQAQKILTHEPIPPRKIMKMILQTIKRQGQFISYYFPRFLILCLLFFIPFLHPVLPFLWFLFNAWILAIQYQDFAMDNNLVNFKKMKEVIHHNKMLSLGFGVAISSMSLVPFLNILVMPAAVIGGTWMFFLPSYSKLDKILKMD